MIHFENQVSTRSLNHCFVKWYNQISWNHSSFWASKRRICLQIGHCYQVFFR